MLNALKIIPIPAFKDNYIWLIHNGSEAIVVDPGNADVVIDAIKNLNLKLNSVFITHHHHDHIDGVDNLIKAYPAIAIYAPKHERYPFAHISVAEPDVIEIKAFNLQFSILDLPGHTLGHIAYYASPEHEHSLLFCGDTLFGAGCGRLFEGSPAQMMSSLQKLATLPPQTQVYCAHEYTLHNINFALTLEPNNLALIERLQETIRVRNLQQPTLPSTIQLELATNPFLRSNSDEIRTSIQLKYSEDLLVFSTTRELRNQY